VGGYSILGLGEDIEAAPPEQEPPLLPAFERYQSSRRADYLLEEDEEESSSHWRMYVALALLAIAAGAFVWQLQRNGFSFAALGQLTQSSAPAKSTPPVVPPIVPATSAGVDLPPSTVQPPPYHSEQAAVQPPPDAQSLPVVAAQAKPLDTTQVSPPKVLEASERGVGSRLPSAAAGNSERLAARRPAPAAPDANQLLAEGTKYLYGDGVTQDCERAQKDLHAAAARSNPDAESLLGTMYASGHCVGRDLPSAYRWYARALRHEPSNNRLQSDLEVIWNQMTSAEKKAAQSGIQ
jgi:hypothetical protein